MATHVTTNEQVEEAREFVEEIASLALSIRDMVALVKTTMAETDAEAEARAAHAAETLCGPVEKLVNQIGFMADHACGLLDGSGEPEILGDAINWLAPRRMTSYSIRQAKAA